MRATETAPAVQIFRGTGELVGRPAAPPPSGASATGDVTLNFVNTDIREIVRVALGDMLRLNFSIDPKVQGTITLQTNRPIARDAVLPALENVLRLNGFALVRANELYSVVPQADLARQLPTVGRGANSATVPPGYNLQLVPLRHVSADEMLGVLKSMVPPDTVLRSIPSRNLLILGGSQRELAGMLGIIEIFDVNWLSGMSFALFQPKAVDAKSLVKELELIFGGEKGGAPPPVRFMPIERMNAVLAITRNADYLAAASTWVDRLDKGSEAADTRIFIYYVQNGRAVDLANVLTTLLTGKSADKSGLLPNSVILTRGPEGIVDGSQLPPAIAVPVVPGLPPLPQAPPPRQGSARNGEGEAAAPRDQASAGPRIMADEINNALLILATPREYQLIESALLKLDVPPLQVLIEAAVAEVTLTSDLRYGVQWFFAPGSSTITLSDVASGAVAGRFPGFSAVVTSGSDIRAALSALESITNVNVISSPKLMVLNNQTATLQVGDQVPIATQSAISTLTPGAPVVNTIQFRDTGVILKVTPRVNEGGLVQLDISQEVSDVTKTTTSGIDSPTIQQRKINSSISVQNGETIALGGLIRDRRTSGDSGIPVLKDIPLFGNLFKTTTDIDTRTELLVLITPRVVRTQVDIRRVTDELRERLRNPNELVR